MRSKGRGVYKAGNECDIELGDVIKAFFIMEIHYIEAYSADSEIFIL
jgi:hypothetical protein